MFGAFSHASGTMPPLSAIVVPDELCDYCQFTGGLWPDAKKLTTGHDNGDKGPRTFSQGTACQTTVQNRTRPVCER